MSEFVYRNTNTGDVVRYPHRSRRLEMLPNWETLQEPTAAKEPAEPTEPQEPDSVGTQSEEPPGGGGGDADGPGVVVRPARSANKAEWQAYARSRARDSDEEASIEDLTKDQLIEQYGGDD
ncbi:hypothetical protein ACIHFC_28800 [Streptomyces sp. NPDC052013]|uniref:hypothetical protein n=1 Tax=Streptomyces sp. NPDC052013 TaxID=3365679 RepID=UPI0037D88D85